MLIAFIAVAILAVGVTGFIGFTIAGNALQAESFNKLTAVREMKANQIEDYFQQISGQVVTLSEDRMIVEAIKDFDDSYREIDSELDRSEEEDREATNKLRRYYSEEYLSRLIPNLQRAVRVDEFWPEDARTQLLQDLYISSNPFDVGSKHLLDNPGDGSRYSEAHELYHPIIRTSWRLLATTISSWPIRKGRLSTQSLRKSIMAPRCSTDLTAILTSPKPLSQRWTREKANLFTWPILILTRLHIMPRLPSLLHPFMTAMKKPAFCYFRCPSTASTTL